MASNYPMKAVDTEVLAVINQIESHLYSIATIAATARDNPNFEGLAVVDHLGQLAAPTHMMGEDAPLPYVLVAHPFDRLTVRAKQLRAKLEAA